MTKEIEIFRRIMTKIKVVNGCWLWTGTKSGGGYARFKYEYTNYTVSRWIVQQMSNVFSAKLDTDHLCRNRECINPFHLEQVTRRVNLSRGINKFIEKTHCPLGHPYEGDNLIYNSYHGGRECKICRTRQRKEAKARYLAKRRGEE